MPTMMDVARRAGVAVSTVSHVVNNTRFVHPTTRAAVEAAIGATGYIPNTIARSLARSSTGTVGIAMSIVSNPYFVALLQAIVSECAKLGLPVLLADTGEDPDRELSVIRSFHQRRVDAVLLAPVGDGSDQQSLHYLRKTALPAVLIDRLIAPGFSQVGVDNATGIRLLLDRLIKLGHRRIGLIAGQPGIATTIERVVAFRNAIRQDDLDPDPELVQASTTDVDAARSAAHALFRLAHPPTAIVAGNNHSMIGLMQAVCDAGLGVPDQLAVVGFDDFEWADCFHPRLTVVAQPVDAIARHAVSLLGALIADPASASRTICLQPSLIIRESCGGTMSR